MCMAIPSKIVALDGYQATVECFGLTRTVSLILMDEELFLGDYVLVQAGNFVYEKVEPGRAQEALALMAEVVASEPSPDSLRLL